MIFEAIPIGGRKNVAYLVGDERGGDVAAVDVGYNPELILDRVHRHGGRLKYVMATHRHRDHIGAAEVLREATGARLAAYKTVPNVDVPLEDGDGLGVGTVRIKVLHTPGHTPDSVCFLIAGQKLLSGDTLYVGKILGAGHCNKRQAQGFHEAIHRPMRLDHLLRNAF